MKASELIAELQRAVDQHGDLDILVRSVEDGEDWSDITVWPDPASPEEQEQGVAGTIDINLCG